MDIHVMRCLLSRSLENSDHALLYRLIAYEVLFLLMLPQLKEISVYFVFGQIDVLGFTLLHFLLSQLLAKFAEMVLSLVMSVESILIVEVLVVAKVAIRVLQLDMRLYLVELVGPLLEK